MPWQRNHGLHRRGLYREFQRRNKKRFRNIVYVGLNNLEIDCDQVLCDGYFAMRDAVRYFYERGHRSVGFIGAEQEGRYWGYLEGLRLCGLPMRPECLVQVDTLEKAKSLPCVFNNCAVFYDGVFQTVNLPDAAYLRRLLKR